MISPGLNSSLPPRFYELGVFKFQELCADLLGQDAKYSDCQVYGRNGQAQFGIDVLALFSGVTHVDVGQCKCWETEPTPAMIRTASDEFLSHLDRWKKHGVQRYILFVACAVDDTKAQDQFLEETKQFNALGVDYEVWDARKIHRKLRPYPHVVRTHLADESWVRMICGAQQALGDSQVAEGALSVMRRQGLFVAELAEARDKELESVRELSAEGNGAAALEKVIEIQGRATWIDLPGEVRAKALRIQANLTLNLLDDYDAAKHLLEQSKAVSPASNSRPLEALLLRHANGLQSGLDFIGTPRDESEWSIRLEFLLEMGRPDDVIAEINAPPTGLKVTVNITNAKALALLLNRQVALAWQEIDAALATKPKHFNLRHAAAMIKYASTISETFPAWGHLTWPVPPDWNFLKRDPVSMDDRAWAENVFHELANLCPPRDRPLFKVWELACIAGNPERQEDAQRIAEQLLSDSPGYVPAMVWATERGYSFDHDASIQKLRQRADAADVTREEIETLIAIVANDGDVKNAEAILDSKRVQFDSWGALHFWRTHKVQCLCNRDDVPGALALVEEETIIVQRRILKTVIFRSIARKTKDASLLAEFLQQEYQNGGEPSLLPGCCEAKAMVGDWRFISEHAESLVSLVQTEGALRLAVQATFNCHEFGLTCKLLDKFSGLCAGGKLPPDLRRLFAKCLQHEGQVPKAISELEKLVQETPDFDNCFQLFSLQQAQGDLPASVLTARSFLEIPSVPPNFLLQVAPVIAIKDPDLAEKLWEKACNDLGDDPSLKVFAAFQAFNLGIEQKAQSLLTQLPEIAASGKAPLKALGLEESIEFFRSANQATEELVEKYAKGEIPVHVLSDKLNWVQAKIFLQRALNNLASDSPRSAPPLFIRHGQKAMQEPQTLPCGGKAIWLDVTSMLLFQGVGLLTLVETAFEKIYVSGHLAVALTEELQKLSHHQPNLLKAHQAVLAALKHGLVQSYVASIVKSDDPLFDLMGDRWFVALEWVKASGGLFVDNFPLLSNVLPPRPIELAAADKKFVVSPQMLVTAMHAAGLITHSAALPEHAIKQEPDEPRHALRAGMTVYLESGIAASLAGSGLLESLSKYCKVFVAEEEAEKLRQEVELAEENKTLQGHIELLLQKISSGQSSGKYQTHLHPSPRNVKEAQGNLSKIELCLYDALHFGESSDVPVCCDDRFIQGFKHMGRSLIIGVTDFLAHLLRTGQIAQEAYYDWLIRLRSANARYIAPTEAELLHFIRRCPISEGVLEETPALRTLRRSVAAMLLDRNLLQNAVINERGEGILREMEFPIACVRAVTSTLPTLWDFANEVCYAHARADWFWQNMFVDFRLFRQCFKPLMNIGADTDLQSVAHTIGLLYSQGIRFVAAGSGSNVIRRSYFDWITTRVLLPLLENTPQLVDMVARAFTDAVRALIPGIEETQAKYGTSSPQALAARMAISQLIVDLPALLRESLVISPELLELWMLHPVGPTVGIDERQFNQRDFWSAAARVVRNGAATLSTADGKEKLRLFRGPNPNTIRLRKGELWQINLLELFHSDRERCQKLLVRHSAWFDLDRPDREIAINRILDEIEPGKRVEMLDAYRSDSMAYYYARLRSKFRKEEGVDLAELMPASAGMMGRFLRIDGAEPPSVERAADRLIESEGLTEAICRLACLPIALPPNVLTAFDGLPDVKRSELLDALHHKLIGFPQRIHHAHLCVRSLKTSDKQLARARDHLEYFYDPKRGMAEARAFTAALRWVNLRLGWLEGVSGWKNSSKLYVAWAHASQLHSILGREDSATELAQWFAGNSQQLGADQAGATTEFEFDVGHPRNVDLEGLLIRGVAYIFAGASDETARKCAISEVMVRTLEQDERRRAIVVTLLRPTSRQPNLLNSFLGLTQEQVLINLRECGTLQKIMESQQAPTLSDALELVEATPHDAQHWTLVEFLRGAVNLTESEKGILKSALTKLNLPEQFKNNANLPFLAMVSCQHAASVADPVIIGTLRSQLLQVAGMGAVALGESKPPFENWDWRRLGGALMDAIWRLNSAPNDPVERTNGFLKDLGAIIRAWPTLSTECHSSLEGLITKLPIRCQSEWLPAQLELRALK